MRVENWWMWRRRKNVRRSLAPLGVVVVMARVLVCYPVVGSIVVVVVLVDVPELCLLPVLVVLAVSMVPLV